MIHPWERRPDEPKDAYELFRLYFEMGEGRSLAKLAKLKHQRDLETRGDADSGLGSEKNLARRCNTLSAKYDWADRVHEWGIFRDNATANDLEESYRASSAEMSAVWSRRRSEYLEGKWILHKVALDRCNLIAEKERKAPNTVPIDEILAEHNLLLLTTPAAERVMVISMPNLTPSAVPTPAGGEISMTLSSNVQGAALRAAAAEIEREEDERKAREATRDAQ